MVRPKSRLSHGAANTSSPFWRGGAAGPVASSGVVSHDRASAGVAARATPIIASRVTSVASRASSHPSVPAGRSGRTR